MYITSAVAVSYTRILLCFMFYVEHVMQLQWHYVRACQLDTG